MKNDVVSILALSYNNLQYMNEYLDSVLNQDYPYIEIVISDDGSSDFSEKDIRNYIKNNNKGNILNVIINKNETNLGIVKNLNKAIKLTTGDYIVHSSCDDVFYSNDVVSNIISFFDNNKDYLIATGKIAWCNENAQNIFDYFPRDNYERYLNCDSMETYHILSCIGSFFPSPGLAYKRELIQKYGFYNEQYRMLDDLPRFIYLTKNGCKIGYTNKLHFKYRSGGIMSPKNVGSPHRNKLEEDLKLMWETEVDRTIKYDKIYILITVERFGNKILEDKLQKLLENLDRKKYDIDILNIISDTKKPLFNENVWIIDAFQSSEALNHAFGHGYHDYYLHTKATAKYDIQISFTEGLSSLITIYYGNPKAKKIAWIHSNILNNQNAIKQFSYEYNNMDKIIVESYESKNEFVDLMENSFDESRVILCNDKNAMAQLFD